MVHLLPTIICFITAALSFHIAPPLNSRSRTYRTLSHRKPYSWNVPNVNLTPFSSPDYTGKSLLNSNVQYETPNIRSNNEPTWVIQPPLINASVGSPNDLLNMIKGMAMRR